MAKTTATTDTPPAFDLEVLTLGEIETIERLSGISAPQFGEDTTPRGKLLAAWLFVWKKRNGEPAFKWNDALTYTLDQATEYLGLDRETPEEEADELDPTEPSEQPA